MLVARVFRRSFPRGGLGEALGVTRSQKTVAIPETGCLLIIAARSLAARFLEASSRALPRWLLPAVSQSHLIAPLF